MANLKINNYHEFKFRINKDEYWDFFVSKGYSCPSSNIDSEKCIISKVGFSEMDCENYEWVYGDADYTWQDAVSVKHTMYNISYTGVDNGLFTFRKDRITNKDFVEIFQGNNITIDENDNRLKLHAVSGSTLQYDYPLHCEDGQIAFNGGFYQGFFKTECDKYQILPDKFEDGETYNLEFTLNKCDLDKESDKTLNDKYPENKGIFFYMGTRSENKWIYLYDKEDVDGLEDCYQLGMDDFVEGGEIDKKDYIIGNFSDMDVDFYEEPPLDIDNYTNFNYYDESLYEDDVCDWLDMSDYLELEPLGCGSGNTRQPKIIDEDEEHITMNSWCCNESESEDYVLRPFFVGCGCPIKYKRVKVKTTKNSDEYDGIKGYEAFGDDYISGWDDIGDIDECASYVERELDISDFEYYTDNGFNLGEANWYYFNTDNKFLIFDRTKSGKTVKNWVEGTEYMYCGRKSNFKGNLFILMNRTKTGYTVHNIDSLRDKDANYYDPYKDLYNNAFALRISDNGEIGYRLLTIDCEKEGRDKTSIMEGYSNEGVIPNCEWVTINVRMTFLGGDKMKLMFYVNGKLKYITKELPRINPRELNDLYEKQEGVPYNISIGGGTQGLAETIQYNYMLNPTRTYPLEKNFAGSFIGYIKSFKMYNCFLDATNVKENYEKEQRYT